MWALWCVETLKIFKVPLCVGPVLCGDFENFSKFPCVWALWCVETLKIFQNSPVCGHCAVYFVETLKIFKITLCGGLVVCGDFENFSKFPCVFVVVRSEHVQSPLTFSSLPRLVNN